MPVTRLRENNLSTVKKDFDCDVNPDDLLYYEDSNSQSVIGTALCHANSYVYNNFGAGADTEIRQQYQVNAMNCVLD
jgi:hypothetical protein